MIDNTTPTIEQIKLVSNWLLAKAHQREHELIRNITIEEVVGFIESNFHKGTSKKSLIRNILQLRGNEK